MKIKIGRLVLLPLAVTALTGCDFFGIFGGDKKEETGITLKDYSQTAVKDSTYVYDGQVFLQYADSTEEDVTSKATFDYSTLDLSKVGKTSYKVKYEGNKYIWTATATIEVVTASLELSNYSTFCKLNTSYTFDGKATLKLSNGADKDVTDKVVVDSSKVKINIEGTYEVKVSYSDQKAGINLSKTFIVKVGEHTSGSLKSITASGYTSQIWEGDSYTFDGVVTATYNEGGTTSQEVVTSKCVFGSINTSSYGNKSLSISFTDSASNTKTTTATIEVMAHVTGIDASEVTVGLNKTKVIGAKVIPSYAKYTGLSYVSNNTSVATVDSDGKVTGKAIGNTTITISSKEAGSTVTKTINVEVTEEQGDAWTILMYVCGANLESGTDEWGNVPSASEASGLASADIDEILSVTGQPDDVHIVIQTGGANVWQSGHSYNIDKTKLERWEVKNRSLVKKQTLDTYTSMGNSSTLQSFLEWGIQNYPADKMGLIFWDHGGGMSGCCFDEKTSDDDGLLHNEVVTAVSKAFTNKGVDKFEFVGYDCCLMQMMEVAEFNSPYFNYQVTSQELENGTGWAYNQWVDDLYGGASTETILQAVVDGFIDVNGGKDATGYSYYGEYYPADQTLSVVNLVKISEFKTAWESMASATKSKITSSNKSTFKSQVVNKTKYFAESSGSYKSYAEFDCYDFLLKLESNSTFNPGGTYIQDAKDAFSAMITYNLAQLEGSADAHGLSCYIGTSYNSSTYTHFTNWSSLVSFIGGC